MGLPKIVSQIFGEFQLIVAEVAFFPPFTKREKKCLATSNKIRLPKIVFQIFGEFQLIVAEVAFFPPFTKSEKKRLPQVIRQHEKGCDKTLLFCHILFLRYLKRQNNYHQGLQN